MPRPSPSASATGFAPGTRRRGNDGRVWVVATTSAGVRRWVPAASSSSGGPAAAVATKAKPDAKPKSKPKPKPKSKPPAAAAASPGRALTPEAWTRATRGAWLTLDQVRALPPGRAVDVLILHRNVWDGTMDADANPPGRAVDAARFFRSERVRLVLDRAPSAPASTGAPASSGGGALAATLAWPRGVGLTLQHEPLHIQHPGSDWWSPQREQDGTVQATGVMGVIGRRVHWTRVQGRALVGWRGPMMLWSAVVAAPRLAWDEDK